jgi:hypothetical protein
MLATRARIRLSHIANVEARRADYTKAERRRILAACLNAAQQNFESLRAELEAEAIGETLPG